MHGPGQQGAGAERQRGGGERGNIGRQQGEIGGAGLRRPSPPRPAEIHAGARGPGSSAHAPYRCGIGTRVSNATATRRSSSQSLLMRHLPWLCGIAAARRSPEKISCSLRQSRRLTYRPVATCPRGDDDAEALAAAPRQDTLTKPPGSLGRLEELAIFLARWQGRPARPSLDRVTVIVFAGNHGVAERGVSAFPAGGHRPDGGELQPPAAPPSTSSPASPTPSYSVVPIAGEPANEAGFHASSRRWRRTSSSPPSTPDTAPSAPARRASRALGEMGIGNTTAAAALCATILGGGAADWVGPWHRHRQRRRGAQMRGGRRRDRPPPCDPGRPPWRSPPRSAAADTRSHRRRHAGGAAPSHSGPARRFHSDRRGACRSIPRQRRRARSLPRRPTFRSSPATAGCWRISAWPPLLDLSMRLGEASGAGVGDPC